LPAPQQVVVDMEVQVQEVRLRADQTIREPTPFPGRHMVISMWMPSSRDPGVAAVSKLTVAQVQVPLK
jgi:hypothetical protein